MSALDERIEILSSSGYIDESGRRDIESIACILTRECGVSRDNELLGTLITHVAAALKRSRDGEPIEPLSPEIVADVKASPIFQEASRIQHELLDAMEHRLSQDEKGFLLVHVSGLLIAQGAMGGGGEKRRSPCAQK